MSHEIYLTILRTYDRQVAKALEKTLSAPKGSQHSAIYRSTEEYPISVTTRFPGNHGIETDIDVNRWNNPINYPTDTYRIITSDRAGVVDPEELVDEIKRVQEQSFAARIRKTKEEIKSLPKKLFSFF